VRQGRNCVEVGASVSGGFPGNIVVGVWLDSDSTVACVVDVEAAAVVAEADAAEGSCCASEIGVEAARPELVWSLAHATVIDAANSAKAVGISRRLGE
jgi:hypothetical protein